MTATAMQTIRKPPAIGHRFADLRASTYDSKARTVEAVLSVGAQVKRDFGVEALLITPAAVNIDRLETCGVPLVDSHDICSIGSVLGRVARVWFDAGKLMGLLAFDDSEVGRLAEGLVTRGTVRGISIGYRVDEWQVTDDEGDVVDPSRLRWDDQATCTYTAVRWTLLESSLVSVPADANAFVRSISSVPIGAAAASDILARMQARQHIAEQNHIQDTEASLPLQRRRRYPGGNVWRGGA